MKNGMDVAWLQLILCFLSPDSAQLCHTNFRAKTCHCNEQALVLLAALQAPNPCYTSTEVLYKVL